MAFITPIIVKKTARALVLRPQVIQKRDIVRMWLSPHPVYDVAAVSTYIAYFLSQYWTGEERKDVEFFAIFMGLIWNYTHDHDATIFIFLWLIGGASEFISRSFLAGGNQVEFERFHVGVKLGGYMSFLLLVFDLLGIFTGY